jgi:NAD(P)-dependent dehydrogenase (short-subunit alcohol dehydrogenase family)
LCAGVQALVAEVADAGPAPPYGRGMTLEGKAAVITGGGGGIGCATGVAMGRAGARVMLVDRDAARLEEAAKAVAETGAEVRVRTADVASSADVRGYVADAVEAFGTIDVLFNNAGIIGPVGALAEYDEDAFDRIMAINVRGVFLGIKYVLPYLGDGAAIVNTGSGASLRGFERAVAYSASKHAVLGITRSVAREVARRGIRVNAVLPGPIEGRMLTSIASGSRGPATLERFRTAVPLGRLGTAEDVAALVTFLLSDEAAFITGAGYEVDGGTLA